MSEDDKQQTEQPAVSQAPDAEGAEAPAEEQAVDPQQTELRDRFGEAVVGFDDVKGYCAPVVAADSLPEVCGALREESGYNFLRCISGIDRGDGLEVAYNLLNLETKDELVLKVKLPDSEPRVPSLTALWSTADWLERETYDLFGIVFEGHPDLRRILLPDDWEGHPLRKDYEYSRD